MAEAINTGRKCLSETVAGVDSYSADAGVNYAVGSATVGHGTNGFTIENIGTVLVWDNANSYYKVLTNGTDIAGVTGTPALPDGAKICITVGSALGAGMNKADTDIGTANVVLPVLFRGPATVINEGLEDSGTIANWATVRAQLEAQGISVVSQAETRSTVAYTS